MKKHVFIYGNQPFEIKKTTRLYIEKIRKTVPGIEYRVLDCANITGKSIYEIDEFIRELFYESLFETDTIIHVKNFHKINEIKAENAINKVMDAFGKVLKMERRTVIVNASVRKITEIKKAFQSFLSELATVKTLVTYDNFNPSSKIIEYAANHSIKLHMEAISVLTMVCGTNLELLNSELLKLSFIFSATHEITVDDIVKSIGNHRKYTAFNLADSVIGKSLKRFTVLSNNYFGDKNNNPVSLFSILSQQYQKMNAVLAMREKNTTPNTIKKLLGVPPWLADKIIGEATHYNVVELENVIIALSHNDLRIKHAGTKNGFLILSDICLKIIRGHYKTDDFSPNFCRNLIY